MNMLKLEYVEVTRRMPLDFDKINILILEIKLKLNLGKARYARLAEKFASDGENIRRRYVRLV